MDHKQKPEVSAGSPASQNPELDEFFERLKREMPQTRPDQDVRTAALHAIEHMDVESAAEDTANETSTRLQTGGRICASCGNRNREGNKFCAMCGTSLTRSPESRVSGFPGENAAGAGLNSPNVNNSSHHYHHHYHHHFFQSSPEAGYPETTIAPRLSAGDRPIREAGPVRAPLNAPAISRAEATVRKLTQDVALACNTKQLDDLVDSYATDALLMRSNTLPIRGSAAIREFFFNAIDSGLGEMELETLRVELVGDVAYDAGRYKMLVPFAMGKRREERGKYLIIYSRRAAGEWKILVDCWSSDLTLNAVTEPEPARTPASPPRPGIPRKSA